MWQQTPLLFQLTTLFIFGICIGSFLNVCIYRLPKNISLIAPRSQCPKCHHLIAWYFNIPLLSYLMLKGRCHYCQKIIPKRYFFVELITGILLVSIYKFSLDTASPFLFFFFFSLFLFGLIVATFVDLELFLIPDSISLGGIPLGILAAILIPSIMGKTSAWQGGIMSLFSGLFGAALLLAIAVIGKKVFKREVMGMGDIKLMAMIGTFLGIEKVCLSLFFGSVIGSVIGIALIVRGNAGWKSKIPFGPYLALGALVALFFGDRLWMWYFGLS